jgi:hypothetical protein
MESLEDGRQGRHPWGRSIPQEVTEPRNELLMAIQCAHPPIIITGMARSGTTMLASLLCHLGLFLGERMVEDLEARFFFKANRTILKKVHGDWDNPFPMRYFYRAPDAVAETIQYVEKDIRSWRIAYFLGWRNFLLHGSLARYDRPWGWKDPRTIFTLPLWLKVFPQAKVLYIVRNGVDVASSLRIMETKTMAKNRTRSKHALKFFKRRTFLERHGFKGAVRCLFLEGGFSLWEESLAMAEEVLSLLGERALIVRYEDVLMEPKRHLLELRRFCGLDEKMDDHVEHLAATVNGKRAYAFFTEPELTDFYRKVQHSHWMERYGYAALGTSA